MNFKNILVAHFKSEKELTFTITHDIVGVVINDMLFNVDDEEFAPAHEYTLSIFMLFEDTNNDQVEFNGEQDLNHKTYKVEINSRQLFHLVIGFDYYRASFQIAARLMDVMKIVLHIDYFNGYSGNYTTFFMRIICVVNLQKIIELFYI